MSHTNRELALKRFIDAKGKWQVKGFEAPNKREEYYITSDDLGDVCNMIKFDPYSEFKAKRICLTHNSHDGLLEALKELLDDILNPRFDEMNRDIILKKPREAIAQAEAE